MYLISNIETVVLWCKVNFAYLGIGCKHNKYEPVVLDKHQMFYVISIFVVKCY